MPHALVRDIRTLWSMKGATGRGPKRIEWSPTNPLPLAGQTEAAEAMSPPPPASQLACDVCSATTGTRLFEATDHREGLEGRFTLVACGGCGLVRTEPRPDDLAAWYPPSYRNHAARPSVTVRAIGSALRYNARPSRNERLAKVVGWLVPNAALGPRVEAGARVLDVGAGNGAAVSALRSRGLDAWGVEPSQMAVEAARANGVETVVVGTLEASELSGQTWDMIRFTHVLEHVPSPVETLRAALAALAPGGRVVVLVPNFAGAGRRLFGRAWDGLELPRHLHHFTRATLTRTFAQAGLRTASIGTAALFGVTAASLDAWSCGGVRQRGWGSSLAARAVLYPVDLALASVGLGEGLLGVAMAESDGSRG